MVRPPELVWTGEAQTDMSKRAPLPGSTPDQRRTPREGRDGRSRQHDEQRSETWVTAQVLRDDLLRLSGVSPERGHIPALVVLPLRLFLGVTLIYAGQQKLTDPQFFNPTAPGFIGRQMSR